jgi:hypothetical protein
MLSPKEFQELYISMYEASDDAREMRRLAAAERRAGNSDRMDAKSAAKYAGSEAKSAERADKKSKGKYIHGTVDEALVYGGKKEEPQDTRMVVTAADKKANTKAWQNYQAGHKGYKAASHIGESAVPGKPAEKLGAVTSIPKDEQDAARERTLAKAAAMRAKKGITKEELELDEAIRNPESRKKLRAIMNTDKGRKGDASKGENPRSKYPSERSKQALNLLHGSGETGSKGNPVRSRGGASAPPEERVGKGPNRAKNAAYWAGNAGPTRDRGAGNKAKMRAAALNKEEAQIDEAQQSFPFKKVEAQREKARKGSVYAKPLENKPVPQVSDSEKKATTRFSKMSSVIAKAKRAKQEADKAGRSSTFYKDTHPESAPKMKKTQREELELQLRAHLRERALDASETKEKESVYKAIKPSKLAKSYPEKSPKELKSLRYAISTAQAKKNMDTSRSDKRYGVEG